MKSLTFLLLILISSPLHSEDPYLGRPLPEEVPLRISQIRKDTSADEVYRLLGKPDRTAKQIIFRRSVEQWIYLAPISLRIEISWIPGETGRVLTLRSLVQPGRD